MEDILLYFSMKYNGQFNDIYKAILNKEVVDEIVFKELKLKLKSHYTTIVSDDYPECLKHISCPPFVLYYYVDLSLLKEKTIGVIGMRKPSSYGIEVTKELVKDLVCDDYVIVSGMALGIDGVAHRQTIDSHGYTVAVLGSGIDYCYPLSHMDLYETIKKGHLVISEYPFDLVPKKWYFPARNRLIAGFSKSLLVTEAKEKSGTMITVGFALEQGKDVMAVPSNIGVNDGCNYLIQQGAKLIRNGKDIREL